MMSRRDGPGGRLVAKTTQRMQMKMRMAIHRTKNANSANGRTKIDLKIMGMKKLSFTYFVRFFFMY